MRLTSVDLPEPVAPMIAVVLPGATVKLFVTADARARAHRRWLELQGRGMAETEGQVEAEMALPVTPLDVLDDSLDAGALDEEDGGATRGGGFNPVRGAKVVARAKQVLDEAVPLAEGSWAGGAV